MNLRQEPELPAVNLSGQSEESGGRKWYFWALVGLAALVGVFAISLIAAIAIALLAEPQDAANWVGLIRDVFIIVLALEGMLMGIALIVLVIHLPRWSTLLQNEVPQLWTTPARRFDRARDGAVHEREPGPAGRALHRHHGGRGRPAARIAWHSQSLRSNSDKR